MSDMREDPNHPQWAFGYETGEAEGYINGSEGLAELVTAIKACLPDLQHYVATHGLGPDIRLETLMGVLSRAGYSDE